VPVCLMMVPALAALAGLAGKVGPVAGTPGCASSPALICARVEVEVEVRVFAPEPICPGPVPILPLVPLVELVPVAETPEPVFPGPVPILPLVPLVELVPVPVLVDAAFPILPVPDWPTFPLFVTPAFFVEVLPGPDLLVFPVPELRFTRLTFCLLTLLLFVAELRVRLATRTSPGLIALDVLLPESGSVLVAFAADSVAGCMITTANASSTGTPRRRTSLNIFAPIVFYAMTFFVSLVGRSQRWLCHRQKVGCATGRKMS
jgi:hypothetical protein